MSRAQTCDSPAANDSDVEISHPIVITQPLRLLLTRNVFSPDNPVLAKVLAPRDQGITPRVLAAGQRLVLAGLAEFREHMGGRLTIPMIRGVGDRMDVHTMDPVQVDAAIATLEARYGHG